MKKFGLLVILVTLAAGYPMLYGGENYNSFKPEPITIVATHKAGDEDFWGHGPSVYAHVFINISCDQTQIMVTSYLWEKETQSDYTFFEGYDKRELWAAPDGYIITCIDSPQEMLSKQIYTDSNWKMDHYDCTVGPVSKFEIMGDKLGSDHPYMKVYFRTITIRVKNVAIN